MAAAQTKVSFKMCLTIEETRLATTYYLEEKENTPRDHEDLGSIPQKSSFLKRKSTISKRKSTISKQSKVFHTILELKNELAKNLLQGELLKQEIIAYVIETLECDILFMAQLEIDHLKKKDWENKIEGDEFLSTRFQNRPYKTLKLNKNDKIYYFDLFIIN